MSLFVCDKCGKECKDKRGLGIHYAKCDGNRNFECEFCNQEFATAYSLSMHVTRCKTMKSRKETMTKEEMASLQSELQQTKNDLSRWMILQQEAKDESAKLQSKVKDVESQCQSRIKEMELKYQKELSDIKAALRVDLEQQLRLRDNDLVSITKDYNDLEKNFKVIEAKYEMLETEKKSLLVDKQTLLETNSKLSLKDTNTTIINQQNNDNRIQMQCFDPSMVQGRIHPPDYVIGNVNDLVRMLRSLGVRNCFRVNDKSRGTISWNKPGEGEIRDPNAEQFLSHLIDSLNSDLIKEKSYYEEELKVLCSADDLDLYQIDESRGFVNFCSELLKKKPETLKKIKRELIKQGKSKNDPEMDQVYEITYTKFVTSIILALFPTMMSWVEKSFYEIGRIIGAKMKDYYHTEGASREKLYIVIHSDNNTNKRVDSKKLMSYISEALNSVIDSELVERIITELVLYKSSDRQKTEAIIKYLQEPTLPETIEIMRGIVSL